MADKTLLIRKGSSVGPTTTGNIEFRDLSYEEMIDFILNAQKDEDPLFMVRASGLCKSCRDKLSKFSKDRPWTNPSTSK